MCGRRARQDALDLWFSMLGEISVADFVSESGYPSDSAMRGRIGSDPRHDPYRVQYWSLPMLSKLKAVRRVAARGEAHVAHADRGCRYRWQGWKAIC